MADLIEIAKIDRSGGTQSRAVLNEEVISEYADAMREGAHFPDIWLIHDGQNYYVTDGFHRIEAALRAGFTSINASVLTGTLADAQWASYSVNTSHGLRRSNDDKRRAVIAALKHPLGAGKSNREIGRHVGVDEKTVRLYREQLEASAEIPQIEHREVSRNGNTYTQNTAKHWGLSNGMAFWKKVEQLGLDKTTILDRLQPGATHLTDLRLTKSYAFERLDMLSWAQRRGAEQPQHGFNLGDQVVIEGSVIVGKVFDLKGGKVCVRRPNPNSPGVYMTHWVKPERVRLDDGELKVGDTVRTRVNHITRIVRIEARFAYVEGDTRGHDQSTLTRLDPLPVAEDHTTEEQAAEDEQLAEQVDSDSPSEPALASASGQWHKQLSSTGILSVAVGIDDWDSLNWLGRYRAIKKAFCPNVANDPFLCINAGQETYLAFDDDAQAIGGAASRLVTFSRHPQADMVRLDSRAFSALQQMGATGIISYRETALDLALLDVRDTTMPAMPLSVKVAGGRHVLVAADGMELASFYYNRGMGPELAQYIAELINQAQMAEAG